MNTKEWFEREKYVALHAQSLRFGIVKYLILLTTAAGIFLWKGAAAVAQVFLLLFILGISVHFLYRWKTKAWTQSWGGYKKLNLPK